MVLIYIRTDSKTRTTITAQMRLNETNGIHPQSALGLMMRSSTRSLAQRSQILEWHAGSHRPTGNGIVPQYPFIIRRPQLNRPSPPPLMRPGR